MFLGVLVPIDPERPMPPPEQRPIGRAALQLAQEGVELVFGDTLRDGLMAGVVARPGGWDRVEDAQVMALHDRFPSQRRAQRFGDIQANRAGLPMGNPVSLTMLCRDKLGCQLVLEDAGMLLPDVTAETARFEELLVRWGAGFLKPRYGALGIGVRRVVPGDALPHELPGAVPGRPDPSILQQAVTPPAGWAGRSVRVLCQREVDGGWWMSGGVVRQSREDPVVNAARGAEVVAAEDALSAEVRERIHATCREVCEALAGEPDGEWLVELGVDVVLDDQDEAHVIEVNSRPRGRLEVLAETDPERYEAAHVAACARPLRRLAAMVTP